jgi:hypothetical protein
VSPTIHAGRPGSGFFKYPTEALAVIQGASIEVGDVNREKAGPSMCISSRFLTVAHAKGAKLRIA